MNFDLFKPGKELYLYNFESLMCESLNIEKKSV